MYQAQQAEAEGDESADDSDSTAGVDDDIVDADFEEIQDDDNQKSA